ncbi:hypothetical protein PsYK624_160480 [Phanerochaete sordida]|uniref:Uncharacterized protein n=1 Tax=Phanerochaete sordida TaxID=48140 RepID=A0A9P3LMY8_9APHY|nr:hypothetical protein PsYK624_160480 [Phanerochaete sordida]
MVSIQVPAAAAATAPAAAGPAPAGPAPAASTPGASASASTAPAPAVQAHPPCTCCPVHQHVAVDPYADMPPLESVPSSDGDDGLSNPDSIDDFSALIDDELATALNNVRLAAVANAAATAFEAAAQTAPAPHVPAAAPATAVPAPAPAAAAPAAANWMRNTGVVTPAELTALDPIPAAVLANHQAGVYFVGYGRDPKRPELGPVCAVFASWPVCSRMVIRVSGAVHRKVPTAGEGFELWKEAWESGSLDELTVHPESVFPRIVTRAEVARRQTQLGMPVTQPPPPAPVAAPVFAAAPAAPAPAAPARAQGPNAVPATRNARFYIVVKGLRPRLYYDREGYRFNLGTNPMATGQVFRDEDEAEMWWAENRHLAEVFE